MSQNTTDSCCAPGSQSSCCTVESLVKVDERGQMILPKSVRDKAGIGPGDKLALVSFERDGSVCCISLIKADNLVGSVQEMMKPLFQESTG